MSLVTDILGKPKSTDISNATYTLLDDIFSYNAIWLQNAIELSNIPILSQNEFSKNISLPLIGFQYKPVGNIELLKYAWSQYPFLSKQVITNSGMKQATKFSVDVFSVISDSNPVAINLLKIQTIMDLLDMYIAKGGLFTILTLYGFITNCVCADVYGVSDGEMLDGTHLRFDFIKPNISSVKSVVKQVADVINGINIGAAPTSTGSFL